MKYLVVSSLLTLAVKAQINNLLGQALKTTGLKSSTGAQQLGPNAVRNPYPVLIRRATIDDARYYTNVAGAAFCSDETLKDFSCQPYCVDTLQGTASTPPTRSIRTLAAIHDTISGTRGYVGIIPSRREIVLSLAAERAQNNRITVLGAVLVNLNVNRRGNNNTNINTGDVKVHGPIYAAASRIIAQTRNILQQALAENPDYHFMFTGHSIGGEIASVASIVAHHNIPTAWNRIRYLGYGTVRVGNREFAKWFNQQNLEATRVVNYNDKVTHIPLQSNEFEHFGNELFINQDGSVRVCDNNYFDDAECSTIELDQDFTTPHIQAFDTTFGMPC